MLAQNFLSHEVLGISEEEQTALIKVLGMFEREEVPGQFSMVEWDSDCGTVHCIGGWADKVLGRDFHFLHKATKNDRDPLYRLFFPSGPIVYEEICLSQAASALRNYLTLGEPHWSEVLAAAE